MSFSVVLFMQCQDTHILFNEKPFLLTVPIIQGLLDTANLYLPMKNKIALKSFCSSAIFSIVVNLFFSQHKYIHIILE